MDSKLQVELIPLFQRDLSFTTTSSLASHSLFWFFERNEF